MKCFTLSLFFLMTSLMALASEQPNTSSPIESLHLTYPAQKAGPAPVQVNVRFELEGNSLVANFEVHNPHINAKEKLESGEYPYQYDAVEIFISVDAKASDPITDRFPYFEFELSPYDQTFEVRVDSLKKAFVDNIDMHIEHHAEFIPGGWKGQIIIPLRNLGWNGDISKILGNADAISGFSPHRNYWSLSIPALQPKPNFHQPKYFQPLFKSEGENTPK